MDRPNTTRGSYDWIKELPDLSSPHPWVVVIPETRVKPPGTYVGILPRGRLTLFSSCVLFKFILWIMERYNVATLYYVGELGIYPVQIRLAVLAALYWLRLEHGTKRYIFIQQTNKIKDNKNTLHKKHKEHTIYINNVYDSFMELIRK